MLYEPRIVAARATVYGYVSEPPHHVHLNRSSLALVLVPRPKHSRCDSPTSRSQHCSALCDSTHNYHRGDSDRLREVSTNSPAAGTIVHEFFRPRAACLGGSYPSRPIHRKLPLSIRAFSTGIHHNICALNPIEQQLATQIQARWWLEIRHASSRQWP